VGIDGGSGNGEPGGGGDVGSAPRPLPIWPRPDRPLSTARIIEDCRAKPEAMAIDLIKPEVLYARRLADRGGL
jgi:hypothetical protein